jgi:hypothetical protein
MRGATLARMMIERILHRAVDAREALEELRVRGAIDDALQEAANEAGILRERVRGLGLFTKTRRE